MPHLNRGSSTALTLQRLLEAEGAFIHTSLRVCELPSMGGGMGVVLTENLAAGTLLARFPFRSMITARKARFNLAMAEVALELRGGGSATVFTDSASDDSDSGVEEISAADVFQVIPFTSRLWSEDEFEARVRSRRIRQFISIKVRQLEEGLDNTEAIVCYVLLMAALYGRWGDSKCPVRDTGYGTVGGNATVSDGAARSCEAEASQAPTLYYTHENAWMRTWIHALPVQYDNLLELFPLQEELPSGSAPHASEVECAAREPNVLSGNTTTAAPSSSRLSSFSTSANSSGWLRSYVSLHWLRAAVLREQQEVQRRYRKCCALLRCLQHFPQGVEVTAELQDERCCEAAPRGSGVAERMSPSSNQPYVSRPGDLAACSFVEFLWGFNTLMSRGFAFPEGYWAMMPFVDYFNYALEANVSMYPKEDDPEDPGCFTNTLLSTGMRDGVNSTVQRQGPVVPRKRRWRTGLRTARVDKGAVPLANYQIYEFCLTRPTRTPGEQLMLHYGSYSDAELLMWYGFVLQPYLLPTSPLSAAPEGSKAGTIVPLLPPLLDDTDDCLRKAAHELRWAVANVASASTRLDYYKCWVASGSSSSAAEKDPDTSVMAYRTWCKALNTAYSLPLSPLVDAEGNCPGVTLGATWLDELLHVFAQTAALAAPFEDAGFEDKAAYRIDSWMRRWGRERWPHFSASAFPKISEGSALGVLGLSLTLRDAIRSSFWIPPSKRISLSPEERLLVVRGVAWAELYVNMSSAEHAAGSTTSSVPVSPNAAAFAREVSVAQWTLLRFLALESSDAILNEYIDNICYNFHWTD